MTSKNNPLWQIRFELPDEALALFSETLEEAFDTFSSRRDNANTPWIIECIMRHKPDMDALHTQIAILSETCGIAAPDLTLEQVPDIDWLEHVYQQFQPFTVERFFIHGSHYRKTPPADFVPLLIDAATAFGTGEHGSTKGCLLALDSLADDIKPTRCLDMGCGSGILSVAMARCFHVPVLAVDNDRECVRVTSGHSTANDVAEWITAVCGDGFNTPAVSENKPYDVITANILAEPLIAMAPALNDVLADGGRVILSGLMVEQADKVRKAYEDVGMKKIQVFAIAEWRTIIMQKG